LVSEGLWDDGAVAVVGRAQAPSIFDVYALSSLSLVAVVGVDVEAEEGVDFDGLGAARSGAEFPAGKGSHDSCGHGGGAGFQHLEIFQIAGGV
jgi:hypothetical protein